MTASSRPGGEQTSERSINQSPVLALACSLLLTSHRGPGWLYDHMFDHGPHASSPSSHVSGCQWLPGSSQFLFVLPSALGSKIPHSRHDKSPRRAIKSHLRCLAVLAGRGSRSFESLLTVLNPSMLSSMQLYQYSFCYIPSICPSQSILRYSWS